MKDDFGSFEGLQSFETGGAEDPNADSFSSFGGMDTPTQSADSPAEISSKSESKDANSLEEYGLQVVQELNANGVLPTPYNYRIYFEKLLENKSQEFKDSASQYVEIDQRPAEKQAILESKVLKVQSNMSGTLSQVGALVKNLRLLQSILKKHEKEVETTNNAIALQNIISVFQKELDKLGEVVDHQLQDVKTMHDRTLASIEGISNEIICDSVYGIYNKRFLEKRVLDEAATVNMDGYKSSLLLIRMSKSLQGRINSDKTATVINRSLSKTLQKVANRSDIVAYYEAGVFGILLSHSDKDAAKRFANRLIEKVIGINIIVGDEEIPLSVCTGIVEINEFSKAKDIIKNALEALKKASNSNISFVVYGEN
ncbi:diguanylate cyclase [Helicobacter sp. MIT 11-5569]|uniref:diguanylate cyclase domain-containing protein n=1 Tax=Helicobacter sp. MIT 11-5569 TaxID=1548151 RepID=UPI00051FEFDD|nr:diguanylate cyclase [Helicobacter sp. MIT 11-5569]TLD82936.1 diguanylate cyclase [Helicobacter sp. MIT 11-5569]